MTSPEHPHPRRRRRPTWPWIVAAIVAALAIAGAGVGYVVADTSRAATGATSAPAESPECAGITRAYQSWAIGRPGDLYEYEALTEPGMAAETQDQEELLEAVQGYDSQASKELATSIARFGSELAVLNAELVIAGSTSTDQAAVVADAQEQLRARYAAWRAVACPGA